MTQLLCFATDLETTKLEKNCKNSQNTLFYNFSLSIEFLIIVNEWFQHLGPIGFETILGLDQGNSFGKTNNKGYLKLGAPENDRNL